MRALAAANDAHRNPVAYTLKGTHAASLEFVSNDGQTGTKPGVTRDRDVKSGDATTVTGAATPTR